MYSEDLDDAIWLKVSDVIEEMEDKFKDTNITPDDIFTAFESIQEQSLVCNTIIVHPDFYENLQYMAYLAIVIQTPGIQLEFPFVWYSELKRPVNE